MNREYKCLKLQSHTSSCGLYSIVPLRDEDKYEIRKWRNEQIYHLRQTCPLSIEDQEKYFKTVVSQLFDQEKPNQILFSYLYGDICIGYGGLVHINWIDKHAEISFIINTDLEKDFFEFHWVTYLTMIEQVAFHELNFHKIFTFAFDLRPQLYNAIEKAGFVREAVLKDYYCWNGSFLDAVIHSKFNINLLKICVLVSGNLGFESLSKIVTQEKVVAIFTDRKSDAIIELANINKIPIFVGNPRNGKAAIFLQSIKCDLLLSVNYLFVVEEDIINLPSKYAVNIHGSLLPKYRGRTPHVWAIINGEKEVGATAHLITPTVDNGPILFQEKIPIDPEDTGASVLDKYKKIYPELISKILKGIKSNSLLPQSQNEEEATYFGKRTPEDGEICWDWQADRIINWVRAQAKPYPGAFTFYNGQKLIIHKARLSDFGFNYATPNGSLIKVKDDGLILKVSNSTINISEIENFESFKFEVNTVFGNK